MVKNRDHWTVEAVHRDDGLSVTGRTGRIRLPAAYVASNIELAYAETSHANQGRTVDRSFLYLDGPTGASGIYVPLSRGRDLRCLRRGAGRADAGRRGGRGPEP